MAGFRPTYDLHNRRIKVFDLPARPPSGNPLWKQLIGRLSKGDTYTKLTCYVSGADNPVWEQVGFRMEGVIRHFYKNGDDAHLWTLYSDKKRKEEKNSATHNTIIQSTLNKPKRKAPALPEGYSSRVAKPSDALTISQLLSNTFDSYPTDLDEETILRNIEHLHSHFRLVFAPDGTLASMASAELAKDYDTAEISDCVTAPDHRGSGLVVFAVQQTLKDIRSGYGITSIYSLSRAIEPAINHALKRSGFTYTGRLINNCRMPTGWESMNVWCLDN